MIIVTGAAGFIGSCIVKRLNDEGFKDLVVVDSFANHDKNQNLNGKFFSKIIERDVFIPWLRKYNTQIQFVFHIGARTDTTEFNKAIFDELNVEYSKEVWKACADFGIPLVYASSAATYGNGESGYEDKHELIPQLKPLNPYGDSKNEFDLWALAQEKKPYFWVGLKFFNVYGPNENHKGRMASVIFHAFHQIEKTGKVKLFRSHNPKYKDGEQLRDFVYVKDLVEVCLFFMKNRNLNAPGGNRNGIYNLGTGKARTFLDLSRAVFRAMQKPETIEWVDTPADIREKYQYFTEAKMDKLKHAGYTREFSTLEQGVEDYVKNYLMVSRYY